MEKGRFKEKNLNEKIIVAIENLPERERTVFLAEEEKRWRIELRSVKENLWKKWRNRREKNDQKSGDEKELQETDGRKRLEKLEKIIERVKSEEKELEERREKDRERKRKWRREKEKEESKMLVREVERVERREQKKHLEEKWALMKWVTKVIEENEVGWEREKIRMKRVTLEEWEKLSENKKQEEIQKNESQKEKSKRKSNSWRDWHPPAILSTEENLRNLSFNDIDEEKENNQDVENVINTVLRSPKIMPPLTKRDPPQNKKNEEVYTANPDGIRN